MKREYFGTFPWVKREHTHVVKEQVIIREQVVCTAGRWINLPKTKPTPKRKHPVQRARHPTRKTARKETEPLLQGLGARIGTGRQVEQGPVLGPLQETIESFHEAISLDGIVASEVLEVGAHEDQAACAALAFGGGDPGLGAPAGAVLPAPHHNPGNRIQYRRVNGPYTLGMTAGLNNKLPFGNYPRLLMAWVSTEAVRTRSRVLVLGKSLSEFMRTLGVYSSDGKAYIRLRNQMNRLFSATVSLIYEDKSGFKRVSSLVADKHEFWWDPKRPDDPSLWYSKIRLGEAFFQEIIQHPVPIDMNTLKSLKRSPLGLDLYLWLNYRTFTLKSPLRLSWPHLYRQFGADPSKANKKRTVDNFRTDCLRELIKIKTAWPDLSYTTAFGALILWPSKPAIPPTHRLQLGK